MKLLPSLKQLEYLVALADTLHFGRASERCNITPSTLSAGIRDLEHIVGVALAERTKRHVLMTPIGNDIADRARRLLRDARAKAEPLDVTYTSLPGATGDDVWRSHAKGRTIRIVERAVDAGCTVVDPGGGAATCQPDDLALAEFPARDFRLRPLQAIFGFVQSWNSLPVLDEGDTEVHCVV